MIDGLGPNDVSAADNITVKELGGNTIRVIIEWGDRTEKLMPAATPHNRMLFDREQYSYEGRSLYELLFGDAHRRVTLQQSPLLAIKPGPFEDTYRLWYDSEDDVLTQEAESHRLFRGLTEFTEQSDDSRLKDLHNEIREEQISRNAMTALFRDRCFGEDTDRIEVVSDGISVDGIFLLTWNAKFFLLTERWTEGAFTPSGDPKQKPGQVRTLNFDAESGISEISVNGVTYKIGKKDRLFMKRLNWILNWRDNFTEQEVRKFETTIPLIQELNI